MTFPQINAEIINGAGSGQVPDDPSLIAALLRPVVFGVPSVDDGSLAAQAESLRTVRFGTPLALIGAAPSSTSFQAQSLASVTFGTPASTSMLEAGPVQSLQSTQFGALSVQIALGASGLMPARFGAPTLENKAYPAAFRPAHFGTPSAAHAMAATSLSSVRFGEVALQLDAVTLSAESLRSVHFGTPTFGVASMRARTMQPVRFGKPMVSREVAC